MSKQQQVVSLKEHLSLVLISILALAQYSHVDSNRSSPVYLISSFLIQVVILLVGVYYFRRTSARCEEQPAILPVIVLTGILSLLAEPLLRLIPNGSSAIEIVMVRAFKNEMLLLAMACCWRKYHPMLFVTSLFLFICSAALSPQVGLTVLLTVLYLASCTIWLIDRYLRRYKNTLQASQTRYSLKRFLLLSLLPVAVMLVLGVFRARSDTWSLEGFLPTSGGTGKSDNNAMEGIGNGDALVAGQENVQTFAPIDDAPFRESHKPSLYDAMTEKYGEAMKNKKQDRSIALSPSLSKEALPELHNQMKKMEESGRQFSTMRKKVKKKRNDIEDVDSKAILHVVGRVPLHLRMELYDFYDGASLIPAPDSNEEIKYALIEGEEFHWYQAFEKVFYEFFTAEESHVLKVVGLDSNVVPAPLHWTGIAIKDVNVESFYQSGQYRVVKLDRKSIPDLIPIHIRSRVLDERHFSSAQVLFSEYSEEQSTLPDFPEMEKVSRLARKITLGCDQRRDKVSAIVNYMRENYKYSQTPRGGLSDEEEEPDLSVSQFLFETKKGPDYDFAIATMLMLRSLNLPCRVVSGYYVDPENYNREKNHTSVYAEDVHFWCEVYLGGNVWHTLEPTPGYEKLAPPLSFYEKVYHAFIVLLSFIWSNLISIGLLLAVCGLLYWQRRPVLSIACYLNWKVCCQWLRYTSAKPEQILLFTRTLIDRFLRFNGHPRPNGIPMRKWMRDNFQFNEQENQQLSAFLNFLDESVYGTQDNQNGLKPDPYDLSRETVQLFYWSRFNRP